MADHAARAHAKLFSPSKADCWIDCTAAPKFVESLAIKDTSSDAAEEGTAAHELLEASLLSDRHPRKFKGKTFNKRFVADDQMVRYVALVFDWCQRYVLDGYVLQAERKLTIACTGDVGTTDITLWNPQTKHLIVADLKYGKGKVVSPVENRQMRLYACGTCDAGKTWRTMKRLTLVIWQPRVSEEPQEWEDSPSALRDFRDKVAGIVQDIKTGKGEFRPSEKACQWCPAKGQCKAFARHAAKAAALDFAAVTANAGIATPSCEALPLGQMVAIYRNSAVVEQWLKAVHDRLFALALQGTDLPGLKVVEGRSVRKWDDEGRVMDGLVKLGYKADEFAPRRLLGIGDVEGLLALKLAPEARDAYVRQWASKPPGKPTLVDADDPRRPLAPAGDFPDL